MQKLNDCRWKTEKMKAQNFWSLKDLSVPLCLPVWLNLQSSLWAGLLSLASYLITLPLSVLHLRYYSQFNQRKSKCFCNGGRTLKRRSNYRHVSDGWMKMSKSVRKPFEKPDHFEKVSLIKLGNIITTEQTQKLCLMFFHKFPQI